MTLTAPTGVAVMPMRRVLGAYWTEARYEVVRAMRAPIFADSVPGHPDRAVSVLRRRDRGNASRNDDAPENLPFLLLTGFSVMGVMGPGIFGFGVSIAIERDQGLTRLKRAQPMPPTAYLAGQDGDGDPVQRRGGRRRGHRLESLVRGVPITAAASWRAW